MLLQNRFRRRVGRRVRAARVSIDMTIDGFAQELCMEADAYSKIEEGLAEPDLPTMVCIADLTGKSLDFLLTGRAPEAESEAA